MPPKRAPLTPEETDQIVAAYEAGDTVRSLARQFHLRTDAVTNVLTSRGVEIRSGRAKLTEEEEEVVVHRYQSGESAASVGRAFGITASTVTRILGRRGVSVPVGRPLGKGWSDADQARIIELYESGMSQQGVAAEMGVSQPVISKVLRRANIQNREWDRPRGEEHGRWQGGRSVRSDGYVLVVPDEADDPYYTPNVSPYVLEHRLVMGKKLGRPLRSSETVHHIDGNRQNNHPDNLQLRQGKHGNGIVYTCLDCGSHNVAPVPLAECDVMVSTTDFSGESE